METDKPVKMTALREEGEEEEQIPRPEERKPPSRRRRRSLIETNGGINLTAAAADLGQNGDEYEVRGDDVERDNIKDGGDKEQEDKL